jgi:hypothetical protein
MNLKKMISLIKRTYNALYFQAFCSMVYIKVFIRLLFSFKCTENDEINEVAKVKADNVEADICHVE